MTERSVTHSTFVLERTYPATPDRVFAAWSSRDAKTEWFGGPDEWVGDELTLDFRVGGREHVRGGPEGGPVHSYDAVYQDIVPDNRIVMTYEMHLGDTKISVSLATVEVAPVDGGTRLVYTEQGAYLDGYDDAGSREEGTNGLLDNLGAAIARESAHA
jgi:uncharacterized protein YndB with AHSA1/START domain